MTNKNVTVVTKNSSSYLLEQEKQNSAFIIFQSINQSLNTKTPKTETLTEFQRRRLTAAKTAATAAADRRLVVIKQWRNSS